MTVGSEPGDVPLHFKIGWISTAAAVMLSLAADCMALDIISRISPRNRERPRRQATRYVILHTTEGPEKGSLQKLYDNGEAHFFIDRRGNVYRIIEQARIAYHSGRSMWSGTSHLDDVSVGIEVSGYYDGYLTQAQYGALRALVGQLQATYGIADDRVLSHSMVAYGAPNRWHRRSHRGRKRCGMLFANTTVRKRLGLESAPRYDPDVKAGRLAVGDAYLARMLYSQPRAPSAPAPAVPTGTPPKPEPNTVAETVSVSDIAGDQYRSPYTTYILPDGRWMRGDQIQDWSKIPQGTRVVVQETAADDDVTEAVKVIGSSGRRATDVAGDEYNTPRVIYILPDGSVRNGAELSAEILNSLPPKTRVLVGYVQGGYITTRRSAFEVCGVRWNNPGTYYLLPDRSLVSGAQVREGGIPRGTQVFFTE